MSHQVESLAVYRTPAWHKLGNVVTEVMTAEDAMHEGGLSWFVNKEPVFTADGNPVEGLYVTRRMTDGRILSPYGVGELYQVIQNTDMFKFFDAVFDRESGRYYHTAGSLKKGQVVFLLAKIPGDFFLPGTDDCIQSYVLLASSHDGSLNLIAKTTNVRVVCSNTLSMALKGIGQSVRIKHTANFEVPLSEAHRVLGLAEKYTGALQEASEALLRKQIEQKAMAQFLEIMFPSRREAEAEPPKQTITARQSVENLFADAPTNNLFGIKGTAWSLYNAMVEYVDHDMPSRGGADTVHRAWFGSGDTMKLQASTVLLNYAKKGIM
jgi:phage/plasmid-like protein (TIGR03299 family)